MTDDNMTQAISLDGPYFDLLALRHEGFCCSQILVKLVLRDLGRENPEMVRAMAALCYGSGHAIGDCGILTGAACALSLSLGEAGKELPASEFPLLLDELVGWFTASAEKSYGGIRCGDILAASPDKRACSMLLMSTLEKLKSMRERSVQPEKGAADGAR